MTRIVTGESAVNNHEAVQIKMLGQFDILFGGESLLDHVSGTSRTSELLRFFIANKGKAFQAEAVINSLWPGNDYYEPKNVFRTYIHRLRKFLESDNALKKDVSAYISVASKTNGYMLKLSDNAEVDTDVFENLCRRISAETDQKKMLALHQMTLEVYTGNFLDGYAHEAWTGRPREQYVYDFCAATNHVLKALDKEGGYQPVIELCEKVFKAYDLDEQTNLRYMEALLETSQTARADQHYAYITQKIYGKPGAAPSAKMKAFYGRLKKTREEETAVTDMVDEETLRMLVADALTNANMLKSNTYSVVFLNVRQTERSADGDEAIAPILESTLEKVLRRNDMYAVINNVTAAAILYNFDIDYSDIILDRLRNTFYENAGNSGLDLDVDMYPMQNVTN